MTEVVLVERTVAFLLSLMGGAAGALVISTFIGVYTQWRQMKELEKQTELETIQAEAAVMLLEELRRNRE